MGETLRLWLRMRTIDLPRYRGTRRPATGWGGAPRSVMVALGVSLTAALVLMLSALRRR
jgi:hypothetical protein